MQKLYVRPLFYSLAGSLALISWVSGSVSGYVSCLAQTDSVDVDQAKSLDCAITVYNQNFGLVKDRRKFALHQGINDVRFEDVAAGIDPTSVSFTSLEAKEAGNVVVREQNYEFDLMDQNSILSKSVGKTIKIRRMDGGSNGDVISGVLMAPPQVTVADSDGNLSERSQSIVLKTASGIVIAPQGQIELAELPEGLVAKPSLLWKIESTKNTVHDTEIGYQTKGLNWKCDYVAVADDADGKLDLTGWVTLDNKSGASYKNTSLKLVAGDVHVVQNAPRMEMLQESMADDRAMSVAAPQFKEQSFAEYHLYSLQNRTDLPDNQTKQLTLLQANAVPVKKMFVLDAQDGMIQPFYDDEWSPSEAVKNKINVKLELANTQENNLGMPMPKGKVRVYKRDKDGALQFVGEDNVDHTSKDEKLTLYLGDAFDVVGERKQTGFKRVSDSVQRSTYEISLRNHKDQEIEVTCIEHASGYWKILECSQPYVKKDSTTFEFKVKVPANSETRVNYELELKY